MAEAPKSQQPPPPPPPPPTLQKPPGYRDPRAPPPGPRPPRPRPPPATKPPVRRRRPPQRRRCSCCRVLCGLLFLLLLLAFLVAVPSALAYLWFQPRLPEFRLFSIRTPVLRVAASRDGGGGAALDATTVVRVQATNPNSKIALWCGGSEVRVAVADRDGDVDVGSAAAAEFALARRNTTVMRFSAASVKSVVVDDAVGSRLSSQIRSKGIRFSVEVRMRVGILIGGKRTGGIPIRVVCSAVSLKRLAGAAASTKCRINLLRWINLH